MFLGGEDLWSWRESTMILGLPLWWIFPEIVFSFLLLAAVALASLTRPLTGTDDP